MRELRRKGGKEAGLVTAAWDTTNGFGIMGKTVTTASIVAPAATASSPVSTAASAAKLQAVLALPDYWDAGSSKDPKNSPQVQYFTVPEETEEFKRVIAPFKKTLGRGHKVLSLKRLQNESLWKF